MHPSYLSRAFHRYTGKTLIGSNEFYIVGPKNDPAAIARAGSAADAYQRIAKTGARFVSRGDNSGTHQKEMQIWQKAGIEPAEALLEEGWRLDTLGILQTPTYPDVPSAPAG